MKSNVEEKAARESIVFALAGMFTFLAPIASIGMNEYELSRALSASAVVCLWVLVWMLLKSNRSK